MAFVALQIDNDQILVASAKVAAKRLQVSHLFSVPLEGDDSQAGESLKTELSKHGLTRSDAIIVVSRGDVEMRELSVPPAPNNELPEMVRFIARGEFATLNENWSLDYFPMSDEETIQRTVLAAGISPELKKQISTIIEPSGLRLKHIVMRSYASADLLGDVVKDELCRLIVDPNGDTTDMSILDGSKLLATRTVRIPTSYDANQRADAMLSEVRRTLASSRKKMGDKKVARVVMFGESNRNKSLEGNLRSHLDLETDFVNPLSQAPVASGLKQPESAERYAALLGALVQNHSGQRHALDFANPRRPIIKKRDYSKWYLYGGVAAALFFLGVIASWLYLGSQASRNKNLQTKYLNLKRINDGKGAKESVEQVLGEIETIDNWMKADVNWLEELYQYSNLALTPDDAIVDLFDAETNTRVDDAPEITIKTRLGSVDKEQELIKSLNSRPFVVDPKRGGSSKEDQTYELSSTFNVSLVKDDFKKMESINKRAERYLLKRNEKMMNQNLPKTEPAKETAVDK